MMVSVIVPTHNRSDALAHTLTNLSQQQFNESWEVIVINNNCADDTDAVVDSQREKFPVALELVYEKKPGAAAARNAGARIAKGEFLVFIDNDILTEPDFLEKHLRALQANENCWIVGAIANLPEHETSLLGLFRKSAAPVDTRTEFSETFELTGANSSLPRRHFIELGGFDENFHVASGEDRELAMRARRQLGIKTLFAPAIVGVHNDWAGTTIEDFCRRQQLYSQTEFYFWQKYGKDHPRLKLVEENLPVDLRKDSFALFIRKSLKSLLSLRGSQAVLIAACTTMEKVFPYQPVLWRLYKAALAGAISRGFHEGRIRFTKGIHTKR
ncbi:MAG: glycosyl transferase family 2 [Acidobacteria bacterium]|jgi:GT2 family glycosyltransferase|nr:glycosyl transferase family 2 [Acidobacteriota bacterium]